MSSSFAACSRPYDERRRRRGTARVPSRASRSWTRPVPASRSTRAHGARTVRSPQAARRVRRWAYLGLNQGPPACEAGALPLSYTPGKRPGMLADGRCRPDRRVAVERSGRDSNPRDGLTPPTRFPVALLQPLGHHSRPFRSIARGRHSVTGWQLFPLRAVFRDLRRLRRRGRSRSFPLAPSASRSRLKLCRGTEAFRGNGTPAEWTKRQAFGHFVFGLGRPIEPGPAEALGAFPAASGFSRFGRLAPRPPRPPTVRFAPGAESEADEAPPGCWKSFGTKARR